MLATLLWCGWACPIYLTISTKQIMQRNQLLIKGILGAALMLLVSFSTYAHWTTKGPYGGHVSAFGAVDTVVFMGSKTGGVYGSTNTQFTAWSYKNYTGLGSGNVTALTSLGRKLVAGTSDSGIYISNDKGVTWAASNTMLGNLHILSLVSTNGSLFAGTDGGGVYMSGDSGATWMSMSTGLTNQHVTSFAAVGDTLLAGTAGGGVFASLNAAMTWTAINTGLTDLNVNAVAFTSTALFVGTPSGVFTANLALPVWTLSNSGLSNTDVHALLVYADSVYAGTDAGVFYADVNNIAWNAAGAITYKVNALGMYGTTLLAGTNDNGCYKSTIGSYNWAASNTGFNNLESYAAAGKDSLMVVATEKGVFVCKNFILSATYVASNNGIVDSLRVYALAIGGGKIFAGTANNGVYTSTDSGTTWTAASTGLGNAPVINLLTDANKVYAALADGTVYSSPLGTISWTQTGSGLPANLVITGMVSDGSNLFVSSPSGVYVSAGGGAWSSTAFAYSATSLAILNNTLYVGTANNGVYKSSLSNPAWTATAALVTNNITALYAAGEYIVAAYKGGAMATCNGGKTWHSFNVLLYIPNYSVVSGLTDITTRIFALNPHHGLLSNSKTEFPEAAPDTLATLSQPSTICYGQTVQLSVANDVEATSYTWTLPSGWVGSSDSNSISVVPDSTSGVLTVTSSNGCGSSPVQTDTLSISFAPGAPATLSQPSSICYGDTVELSVANDVDATSYTWTLPNGWAGSSNSNSITVVVDSTSGVITVASNNGCGASPVQTDTLTVANCTTGIQGFSEANLSIFPNPFASELVVTLNGLNGNVTLVLSDITGKTLSETIAGEGATVINTTKLAKGMYILRVVGSDKVVSTHKLIKVD